MTDFAMVRFSTAVLPPVERVPFFREVVGRTMCKLDIEPLGDHPFRFDATLRALPGLGVISLDGAGARVERTRQLMADGNDDIILGYHEAGPGVVAQLGREAAIAKGEAILLSNADRGWAKVSGGRHLGLRLSRAALAAAVPGLEDRLVRPIAASNAALRSLSGYLKVLDQAEALATPELQRLVVAYVYDLAALAIGPSRDAAAIAEGRGLRAARLREVIAAIEAGFPDPALSPERIALRLGVSSRYVQDLLHDTGLSFTARVLELRLQRARAMLADPVHGRLRVGEIADACGFNEIPYFNRCFRRRFGASPTEFRGGDRFSG